MLVGHADSDGEFASFGVVVDEGVGRDSTFVKGDATVAFDLCCET